MYHHVDDMSNHMVSILALMLKLLQRTSHACHAAHHNPVTQLQLPHLFRPDERAVCMSRTPSSCQLLMMGMHLRAEHITDDVQARVLRGWAPCSSAQYHMAIYGSRHNRIGHARQLRGACRTVAQCCLQHAGTVYSEGGKGQGRGHCCLLTATNDDSGHTDLPVGTNTGSRVPARSTQF